MRLLLLISMILFSQASAFAYSDCETRDFHKSNPEIMEKLPVYDQDGTGACYSYVTAQLLDFERLKEISEGTLSDPNVNAANYEITSPLHTAYTLQFKYPRTGEQVSLSGAGGKVEDAIRALEAEGICSTNFVDRRMALFKNAARVDGPKQMTDAQLVYFMDSMHMRYLGSGGVDTEENMDERNGYWMTTATCNMNRLKATYRQFGFEQIAPIYIFDYMFNSCPTKTTATSRRLVTRRVGTNANMRAAIDDRFKADRPPAIDLCSNVLYDPAKRGLKTDFRMRDAEGNRNAQCGQMHSVLLTGQKKINGQCNYLVRNSWGANWASSKATTCSCKRNNGSYDDNCDPKNTRDKATVNEYLGCWFKRDDILPNTGVVNGY